MFFNKTTNFDFSLPNRACQCPLKDKVTNVWDHVKIRKRLGTPWETGTKFQLLRRISTSVHRRILTSHVALYSVKRSLHMRSLIKLFTQAHRSHSKSYTNNGFFKFVQAMLLTHSCLFSHSAKTRALPLSAVTLAVLPATMAAFNSYTRLDPYYRNSGFPDAWQGIWQVFVHLMANFWQTILTMANVSAMWFFDA